MVPLGPRTELVIWLYGPKRRWRLVIGAAGPKYAIWRRGEWESEAIVGVTPSAV